MSKHQVKAIANALGKINQDHLKSAAHKQPHEMTADEYMAVFAIEGLRLTEFNTRIGPNFRPLKADHFLFKAYLNTINDAMDKNLKIPLSILRELSCRLDKKKLIRYLRSIGLNRGKLVHYERYVPSADLRLEGHE